MCTGTDARHVEAGSAGSAEINAALRSCRAMMTCSPLPLVAVEGQEHAVRYVNPAFCLLVGKEAEELLNRPFALAVPEGKANGCIALLERVTQTGVTETLADQEHARASLPDSSRSGVYWSYVAWPILANEGHTIAVMIQVTDSTGIAQFRHQVTTMNQELLLSSVRQHELREVAEALNARLQALATTDGLTGLNNHRTFQELLQEEVERAQRYNAPLSLLFLDVDDFKGYNDTFGHPAGDAVLHKIGEVLKVTARGNDLAARYGGEEFAVILIETDVTSARIAAERFRAAIERVPWEERPITISVGAATLSPSVCDPAALIAAADTALYRAKARGRNCVLHSADVPGDVPNVEEMAAEAPSPATNRHALAPPSTAPRMQQALNEFRAKVEDAVETIGASLQSSQDAMVVCLSRLVESRDEETQEHSLRVTE